MSNMFGQYTPAKYLANKVKNDPPRRLKNLINRVTGGGKADDAVKTECGKAGGEECAAYAGSSRKPASQMSETAIRSKKSNFHKPKHNLKKRIVYKKGDA